MPDQVPDGSAVITPNRMYEELQAVHAKVNDLVTKLDPALADLRTDVNDHETRMRVVEAAIVPLTGVPAEVSALQRARWKAQGAVAVGAALLSSGVVVGILELVY